MATISLTPTYIGQVGSTGIYRVDLGQSGLGSVQAVTIYDDNVLAGGTGGASGFDLDFIRFSTTLTSDPSAAGALPNDGSFDFGTAGVVFRPGLLQTWDPADPAAWNTANLLGTSGANVYDPGKSTFETRDGDAGDTGALSLGEAGQVTFLLNGAVATAGRYLYFGDDGGGNDGVRVTVSDVRAAPASTGVTLTGTGRDDTIALGQGFNLHLGAGNDVISGAAGNDTLHAGAGDDRLLGIGGADTLHGEAGNDELLGGDNDDTVVGGDGNDALSGGPGNDFLLGEAGDDTMAGDDGNDALSGGAGNDILLGEAGDDTLAGGDGNDRIAGGLGRDTLLGEAGADAFSFASGESALGGTGVDTIMDWNGALDSIDMTRAGSDRNYAEDGTGARSVERAAAYAEETFTSKRTDHVFLYNGKSDTGYLLSDLDNDNRFETAVVLKGAGSSRDFGYADII